MHIRVNCRKNDSGIFCKDKRIKRSLFGIGARLCIVPEGKTCPFQEKFSKPQTPIRASQRNEINKQLSNIDQFEKKSEENSKNVTVK